jgi:hypothetical protein
MKKSKVNPCTLLGYIYYHPVSCIILPLIYTLVIIVNIDMQFKKARNSMDEGFKEINTILKSQYKNNIIKLD